MKLLAKLPRCVSGGVRRLWFSGVDLCFLAGPDWVNALRQCYFIALVTQGPLAQQGDGLGLPGLQEGLQHVFCRLLLHHGNIDHKNINSLPSGSLLLC